MIGLDRPDSALVGQVVASPNHGERIGGPADALVLHYTGMPAGAGALAWLCDPRSQVSCHYFVEENGAILQLVGEDRRAWHAGRSYWQGETDLNSRSIGIEIVNPGHEAGCPPFPDVQIEAVIALCRDIADRNSIAPERILAHSDIAPGRKRDPGEVFPWNILHQAGVGHFVTPAAIMPGRSLAQGDQGQPVVDLQKALADYGYNVSLSGEFDTATVVVVAAFQRHFRPALVDGVADSSTRKTLAALIAALRRVPLRA